MSDWKWWKNGNEEDRKKTNKIIINSCERINKQTKEKNNEDKQQNETKTNFEKKG